MNWNNYINRFCFDKMKSVFSFSKSFEKGGLVISIIAAVMAGFSLTRVVNPFLAFIIAAAVLAVFILSAKYKLVVENISILGFISSILIMLVLAKNIIDPLTKKWEDVFWMGTAGVLSVIIVMLYLLFIFFGIIGKSIDVNKYQKSEFRKVFINWLTFWFVSVVFIPCESYFSNMGDFDLRFKCIVIVYIPLIFIISYLLSGWASTCKRPVVNNVSCGVCGVTLAMYVQYMFANQLTMLLDGSTINWSEHTKDIVLNSLLWAVIILIPFVIYKLAGKIWERAIIIIPGFILGIHVITLTIIAIPCILQESRAAFAYLSTEEQFCVSSEDNIIVFVIDAIDNEYIKQIYKENPEVFADFKDFTMYADTCSVYDSTIPSTLSTFAGGEYHNDISAVDWYHECWTVPKTTEFYSRIHDAGYQTHFYNFQAGNPVELMGSVDNMVPVEEVRIRDINYPVYNKNMLKLSSYRLSPYVIKQLIDTSDISFKELIDIGEYVDPSFLNEEFDENCQLKLADNTSPLMIYQHLKGTHTPCDDFLGTTKYCLGIAAKYIDQMKQLGVYDNATILIMSDHGKQDTDYDVPAAATPMVMIKEPNSSHESIAINNAPIYHTDIIPTILENIGCYDENNEEDVSLFGTSVYMHHEGENRERVWYDRWTTEGIKTRFSKYAYHTRFNSYYKYKYTGTTEELDRIVEAGEIDEVIPIYDFAG